LFPGSILFESACIPVSARRIRAFATTASAGKSVLVLAIWVETFLI